MKLAKQFTQSVAYLSMPEREALTSYTKSEFCHHIEQCQGVKRLLALGFVGIVQKRDGSYA